MYFSIYKNQASNLKPTMEMQSTKHSS